MCFSPDVLTLLYDLTNLPLEPIYSLKRFFEKEKREKSESETGFVPHFIQALNLETKTETLKIYASKEDDFWPNMFHELLGLSNKDDVQPVSQNVPFEDVEHQKQIKVVQFILFLL